MDTVTAVDVQGFAGAFTLGAIQAGMTLTGKIEAPGGFGVAMCEANRHLLGDEWESQVGTPDTWEVPSRGADVVFGNPPCSGFSVMSPQSFRGVDSTINQCMRDMFAFSARARPKAVVMESVGSAYAIGLGLMRALAAGLIEATGTPYFVTHVLQNNLSLGGCTRRRRYFLVVTDCPFGVERERLPWIPTMGDAIGDLRGLPLTWDAQPYDNPPTWWSVRQRSADGLVDGHMTPYLPPKAEQRLMDIAGPGGVDWYPREVYDQVVRRYYEQRGDFPESMKYQSSTPGWKHLTRDKVILQKDFKVGGYAQPKYWPWDEPGYVMTGHGPGQVWHPNRRQYTHREAARVMGFPDDWRCGDLRGDRSLGTLWGKGISVDCGRWVLTWVRNSLLGRPGSVRGERLPDATDRVIDVVQDWKLAPQASLRLPAMPEE